MTLSESHFAMVTNELVIRLMVHFSCAPLCYDCERISFSMVTNELVIHVMFLLDVTVVTVVPNLTIPKACVLSNFCVSVIISEIGVMSCSALA